MLILLIKYQLVQLVNLLKYAKNKGVSVKHTSWNSFLAQQNLQLGKSLDVNHQNKHSNTLKFLK